MVKKKITPTETIENTANPELESAYLKTPGGFEDASSSRSSDSVGFNWFLVKKTPRGKYSTVHTHLSRNKYFKEDSEEKFPSARDFEFFLKNDNMGTMGIAERDSETGRVLGYHFIRKTKDTPTDVSFEQMSHDIQTYALDRTFHRKPLMNENILTKLIRKLNFIRKPELPVWSVAKEREKSNPEALEDICKKYQLQIRSVPNKSYTESFNKKIEEIPVAFFVTGLVGIIFSFNAPIITGNAISNISYFSNPIFIILFLIGLIGILINFKPNFRK